jgi:uncharacterized membrane protein
VKTLFRYIFIGTLTFIPLFIVIQIILWVNKVSIQLFSEISKITNNYLYSGLIILLVMMFLALIGFSTEKFGKALIIGWIENILEKLPAIGTIYSIAKKVTNLFMTTKKEEKKEVVLVEYPKEGMWVIGYILSKYHDTYVLFIPTSPNPTSGYTVIVHKNLIHSTTLSITEASQFIVSMGADFVKQEEIDKIVSSKIM